MYMHVLGHGDPVKLAAALHTALAESKTPLSPAASTAPATPPPIDLDTAAVDQTLGAKGTNNGGVYQFGIPRAEPIMDGGMVVQRLRYRCRPGHLSASHDGMRMDQGGLQH
jgi:hypothetical protein